MVIAMDYHYYEPNSTTPKLSLSKLPCKPKQPPQMLTPPFQPPLSIPFQWEDAPGKPRSPIIRNNKVARSLDLPPRLDAKITTMPSPTTVLDDGPYVGRSLSLACTLSFRKGPVITDRDNGGGSWKKGKGGNFGSGRWESKGSFDFSPPKLGEVFGSEKNVKVTRVGRKRSFFSLSSRSSNLWGDIYSSFKKAVPWRRRR